MRAWKLPIVVLALAAVLGGCGQKGPLYRENPEVTSEAVENAAGAGVQNQHSKSRDSDVQ